MVSRKSHRKHKSHRRRHSRKEGGAMLNGAPVSYSLANDWSSKMSMGQGGDYLKYHVGQHGGALAGAPLSEMGGALPSAMRGPAMLGGLDRAFNGIAGLKDQAGGKRRKHSRRKHSRRKHSRRRHSRRKHSRRKNGGGSCGKSLYGGSRRKNGGSRRKRSTRRSKGGALGYAPISSASMLLDSAAYSKAGLNPDSGVEFDAAAARQRM
jgi:hypothetical protein